MVCSGSTSEKGRVDTTDGPPRTAHLKNLARAVALVGGAAWIGAALTAVEGCSSSGTRGASAGAVVSTSSDHPAIIEIDP